MLFKPTDKMWDRIEVARSDADTTLFFDLMYLGEFVTKIIASSLVATIDDDRDKHRYRQYYFLVRSDGIGDWTKVIDEVLIGPASQFTISDAQEEKVELTQKVRQGSWQFDAVDLIHKCLKILDPNIEDLPIKVDGRAWFSYFARLRNKTRGHGAISSQLCGRLSDNLETSLNLIINNYVVFKRPWAYLYKNLSGKYRVTKLTESAGRFDYLKSTRDVNVPNGIYIHYDEGMVFVELFESTVDAIDFYLPNGAFKNNQFEVISYITGNVSYKDSTPYLVPATQLPSSETQGIGILEIQGNCFGNLPTKPEGYINRKDLENELFNHLLNDRHPIITLVGRGGIGKTSLALTVLHEISKKERFNIILWLSARDIDLLEEGPKLVKPQVLTIREISKEVASLMNPSESRVKGFIAEEYFANELQKNSIGPMLVIFDNFETVDNPVELYSWIDTYIRNPNKVLITTRHREFKGDYPVEVTGMNKDESLELINLTTKRLDISNLVTPQYAEELFRESDGHPYIIKILLGELAKNGRKSRSLERIVANRDDILTALFERTYSSLSELAKRVFLTLCNWRSTIPKLALEGVLLNSIRDEKADIDGAINELNRCSFIEIVTSNEDKYQFINLPLTALVFGKRKLTVSPLRSSIEADTNFLQFFGAAQKVDIRHGIEPRINKMYKNIAKNISSGNSSIEDYQAILEFISRHYPPSWLMLASLYEEQGGDVYLAKAKVALELYLENSTDIYLIDNVWNRIASIYEKQGDWFGMIHANIERSQLPDIPIYQISNAANRLNHYLVNNKLELDTDEKQILVKRLVEVMETRISGGTATDCSRLAWLCLHLKDEIRARRYTNMGLKKEPSNDYCIKLQNRLQSQLTNQHNRINSDAV